MTLTLITGLAAALLLSLLINLSETVGDYFRGSGVFFLFAFFGLLLSGYAIGYSTTPLWKTEPQGDVKPEAECISRDSFDATQKALEDSSRAYENCNDRRMDYLFLKECVRRSTGVPGFDIWECTRVLKQKWKETYE